MTTTNHLGDVRLKQVGRILLLSVIPILLGLVAFKIRAARGPYWLGQNFDPEYAYLLNGLNLCNGQLPGLFQHPGTPFQVFLAWVIRATYMFTGLGPALTDDVLGRPEHYLASTWLILTCLDSLFCWLSGLLACRARNSVLLGLCVQSSLFLSVQTLDATGRVTPERFLMLGGVALSTLVLCNSPKISRHFLVAAAGLLGFLVATKLTAVPLLVIPVLMVHDWRSRFRLMLLTCAAFLVFTLPIWPHYRELLDWTGALLTHTGYYGHGASGVIEPHLYLASFSSLFDENRLFVYLLLLSLVFLARERLTRPVGKSIAKDYPIALSVCAAQALQFVIVAKHCNAHYLIPCLMLSGLNLAFVSRATLEVRTPFRLLLAAGLIYFSLGLISHHERKLENTARIRDESLEAVRWKVPLALPIAYYYRCSAKPYALCFGDEWAHHNYATRLKILYPNILMYDVWSAQFRTIDGQTTRPPSTFLMHGTPFTGASEKSRPAGFELTTLKETRSEALYQAFTKTF